MAKVTPTCPNCEKKMRERTGKYGPFFGCRDYPECKGIVDYDDAEDMVGEEAEKHDASLKKENETLKKQLNNALKAVSEERQHWVRIIGEHFGELGPKMKKMVKDENKTCPTCLRPLLDSSKKNRDDVRAKLEKEGL